VEWALWLAAPLVATLLAALVTWWRGRPPTIPNPAQAMRAHQRYLDALGTPPRQRDRLPNLPSDHQSEHPGAPSGVDKVRK
jgi:hypothetical protein